MGFRDLVLFYVVTGVSLRWIALPLPASDRSSITLIWLGAWLFFVCSAGFIGDRTFPLRYPAEGGLYVWTKKAFGEVAWIHRQYGRAGTAIRQISRRYLYFAASKRSVFAAQTGSVIHTAQQYRGIFPYRCCRRLRSSTRWASTSPSGLTYRRRAIDVDTRLDGCRGWASLLGRASGSATSFHGLGNASRFRTCDK